MISWVWFYNNKTLFFEKQAVGFVLLGSWAIICSSSLPFNKYVESHIWHAYKSNKKENTRQEQKIRQWYKWQMLHKFRKQDFCGWKWSGYIQVIQIVHTIVISINCLYPTSWWVPWPWILLVSFIILYFLPHYNVV